MFFEIVLEVLDPTYAEIDESNKDELITKKLSELQTRYNDVLQQGGPSYEDEICRFAYVFRYATAHADYLYQVINSSDELKNVLKQDNLHITCIGGGPGSGALGFLKYILTCGHKPKITYFILDKEQAWVDTWADFDALVSNHLHTSRNYVSIDVSDRKAYKKQKKCTNLIFSQ